MGAAQAIQQMTEVEYLAFEETSDIRHEFYQGEIFDMAGGSIEHNTIVTNTASELHQVLKGKRCRVFTTDLRIKVKANSLFTYPDITIVCDEPKRYERRTDTITNPTVIVEVLSPSTANYDRGEKFELYRDIPTLKEYILIYANRIRIERFVRTEINKWLLTDYKTREEMLYIESIGESIPLEEIYSRVVFAQE